METKVFKVNLVEFARGGGFYAVVPVDAAQDCNRCAESCLSLPQHDMRLALFFEPDIQHQFSAEILCPKCGDALLNAQAADRTS